MIKVFWSEPENTTIQPVPEIAEVPGATAPSVKRAKENSLKAAGKTRPKPPEKPTPPPTRKISPL